MTDIYSPIAAKNPWLANAAGEKSSILIRSKGLLALKK